MDERDWTDRPLPEGGTLDLPGCRIAREAVAHVSLVTGDLDAALAVLAPGAPMLGLAEGAAGADYAIRVARDHAVLVTAAPPGRPSGWQGEGFALSRADDRYARLSLTGPEAPHWLAHGLASPLPAASPSAAIRFAGRTVLLTGVPGGFALWADPADLTALTGVFRSLHRT